MKRQLSFVALAAATVVLSACNPGAGSTTPAANQGSASAVVATNLSASEAVGEVKVNQSARDLLPTAIRDSGVLKIGGETQLPPYLYKDGDKIVGIEADFMVALGKSLGLQPQIENTKFASMVTGLTSKRIDVAMSDFSDTLERQKQVTFIDYTKAGQQLVVQKGNPKKLHSMADLCGTVTGGPSGALAIKLAQEQSDKCVAAGKPAIDIKQFPATSDASLALSNKRIDAMAVDAGLASLLARESPEAVETVGDLFGLGYHGAAVRPEDSNLQKALQSALDGLMQSGTYESILKKWDVERMRMDRTEINATKS
ncbi:MAG TPA: ABC transporter substrate-binding protein [Candidatus Sulfotelmatobacter sp.]|nr:ABC transporter substrate-binding protein [Candidatus Sulfotelmatobacter sp.]